MKKYTVTGMSCAACQTRVEKAVQKVPGVKSCSVSLLTNSLAVEGEVSETAVQEAVEKAGYGFISDTKSEAQKEDALEDRETPKLKKRFLQSLVFLLVLMTLSMGPMLFHFSLPAVLRYPGILALTEMLLAIIVMLINKKFFTSGFSALFRLAPNMDSLVALGSSASFLYSLGVLYGINYYLELGNAEMAHQIGHHLYFETAAMIPTLITLGKMLESISKGRTTSALKGLMNLSPKTAVLLKDGVEKTVSVDDVAVGDVFAVKPGEQIPVDGLILSGRTAIDESALTGESIPADKEEGDKISAGTLNRSGYITAKAVRIGKDTSLSQIIEMVSDAAATKAPIARIADKISAVFVPFVMGIALLTFLVVLGSGAEFSVALSRGVAVLVISCPCALGLATPVAIMVGNGVGAKNGILFKTASSLEEAGRVEIIALDKTGTVTNGTPVVTDIAPVREEKKEELLKLAVSIEKNSEHPLAKAIQSYGEQNGISPYPVEDFQAMAGHGITASYGGEKIIACSEGYLREHFPVKEEFLENLNVLSAEGKTNLFFLRGEELLGAISVADSLKTDAKEGIEELKKQGVFTVMLTGDRKNTAEAIAKEAGVDLVIAEVLPDGKEEVIRKLQEFGKVAMVGDGINDAIALTRADLGIAIGAGTDVAIDAADIVLMKSNVSDIPRSIRLSRATIHNIHENLFWAFFYNVICIPLAAGFYSAVFHWNFEMNPMVGALAMSLSSVTVCLNALRLNLFSIKDTKKDRKKGIGEEKRQAILAEFSQKGTAIKNQSENTENQEEKRMEKKMEITGMMCGHCEARVKKALEAVSGVDHAEVSHENGTATVFLKEEVDNATLKAAVEAQDYGVTNIE